MGFKSIFMPICRFQKRKSAAREESRVLTSTIAQLKCQNSASLDALVSRDDGKQKVILPVWHQISKADIASYALLLADKLAVSTSKGIEVVAQELVKAISKADCENTVTTSELADQVNKQKRSDPTKKSSNGIDDRRKSRTGISLALRVVLISLLGSAAWLFRDTLFVPPNSKRMSPGDASQNPPYPMSPKTESQLEHRGPFAILYSDENCGGRSVDVIDHNLDMDHILDLATVGLKNDLTSLKVVGPYTIELYAKAGSDPEFYLCEFGPGASVEQLGKLTTPERLRYLWEKHTEHCNDKTVAIRIRQP